MSTCSSGRIFDAGSLYGMMQMEQDAEKLTSFEKPVMLEPDVVMLLRVEEGVIGWNVATRNVQR